MLYSVIGGWAADLIVVKDSQTREGAESRDEHHVRNAIDSPQQLSFRILGYLRRHIRRLNPFAFTRPSESKLSTAAVLCLW